MMKPEDLVKRLETQLGENLKSVILYGSAAGGDHAGAHSDYNVLVVAGQLDVAALRAASGAACAWARAGNPPPMFFTQEGLRQSADVFPIELLDMKEANKVLFGEDVLTDIDVSTDNLRLQLEHELRGKLIHLREHFLLTGARPRKVFTLMIESLSSFLVLSRAALRLFQKEVPVHKIGAVEPLGRHLDVDLEVFRKVDALKRKKLSKHEVDAEELFAEYLETIGKLVEAVDAYQGAL
ncbi:MAG: hypothetical protein EOM20_04290 [Spartobacteria bacterium]|nr:hypothetical protein [Spartobacteria bacterium]